MKKGQGLSITTIVVAAIALLVLVVLVAVFAGNATKVNTAVNSCVTAGGVCLADGDSKISDGTHTRLFTASCLNPDGATETKCYSKLQDSAFVDGE